MYNALEQLLSDALEGGNWNSVTHLIDFAVEQQQQEKEDKSVLKLNLNAVNEGGKSFYYLAMFYRAPLDIEKRLGDLLSADPIFKTHIRGIFLLGLARKRKIEFFKSLLKIKRVYFNNKDFCYEILSSALYHRRSDVFKWFLEKLDKHIGGAHPREFKSWLNHCDGEFEDTLLHIAFSLESMPEIMMLIDRGAYFFARNYVNCIPLEKVFRLSFKQSMTEVFLNRGTFFGEDLPGSLVDLISNEAKKGLLLLLLDTTIDGRPLIESRLGVMENIIADVQELVSLKDFTQEIMDGKRVFKYSYHFDRLDQLSMAQKESVFNYARKLCLSLGASEKKSIAEAIVAHLTPVFNATCHKKNIFYSYGGLTLDLILAQTHNEIKNLEKARHLTTSLQDALTVDGNQPDNAHKVKIVVIPALSAILSIAGSVFFGMAVTDNDQKSDDALHRCFVDNGSNCYSAPDVVTYRNRSDGFLAGTVVSALIALIAVVLFFVACFNHPVFKKTPSINSRRLLNELIEFLEKHFGGGLLKQLQKEYRLGDAEERKKLDDGKHIQLLKALHDKINHLKDEKNIINISNSLRGLGSILTKLQGKIRKIRPLQMTAVVLEVEAREELENKNLSDEEPISDEECISDEEPISDEESWSPTPERCEREWALDPMRLLHRFTLWSERQRQAPASLTSVVVASDSEEKEPLLKRVK